LISLPHFWRPFCMKRLSTLKSFQKFKIKIKKWKTYSGWCPFPGLSNGTTVMQIHSGRTVPLNSVNQCHFSCTQAGLYLLRGWRAGAACSRACAKARPPQGRPLHRPRPQPRGLHQARRTHRTLSPNL
jgi:hypothetical protein